MRPLERLRLVFLPPYLCPSPLPGAEAAREAALRMVRGRRACPWQPCRVRALLGPHRTGSCRPQVRLSCLRVLEGPLGCWASGRVQALPGLVQGGGRAVDLAA